MIEKEELGKEEKDSMIIDLNEEIITDHTIEITIETSIEEEKMETDLLEDKLKDTNPEEKNLEREPQFNGAKLMKSVPETKESTSSSRYSFS